MREAIFRRLFDERLLQKAPLVAPSVEPSVASSVAPLVVPSVAPLVAPSVEPLIGVSDSKSTTANLERVPLIFLFG